jgi:hypothetical protein
MVEVTMPGLTKVIGFYIIRAGDITMSDTQANEHSHNEHVNEARQHMRAARKAMHATMKAWLPEGFIEQRQAARKEFLLAMRSLVDAAIEHVDEKLK